MNRSNFCYEKYQHLEIGPWYVNRITRVDNNIGFILYTVLTMCYLVVISDKEQDLEMR